MSPSGGGHDSLGCEGTQGVDARNLLLNRRWLAGRRQATGALPAGAEQARQNFNSKEILDAYRDTPDQDSSGAHRS